MRALAVTASMPPPGSWAAAVGRVGRHPDDFATIWKPAGLSPPANLTRHRYRPLPYLTLVIRIAPGWRPDLWMTVCDLWGEGQHPCG
jgi:hypothetical protein